MSPVAHDLKQQTQPMHLKGIDRPSSYKYGPLGFASEVKTPIRAKAEIPVLLGCPGTGLLGFQW